MWSVFGLRAPPPFKLKFRIRNCSCEYGRPSPPPTTYGDPRVCALALSTLYRRSGPTWRATCAVVSRKGNLNYRWSSDIHFERERVRGVADIIAVRRAGDGATSDDVWNGTTAREETIDWWNRKQNLSTSPSPPPVTHYPSASPNTCKRVYVYPPVRRHWVCATRRACATPALAPPPRYVRRERRRRVGLARLDLVSPTKTCGVPATITHPGARPNFIGTDTPPMSVTREQYKHAN